MTTLMAKITEQDQNYISEFSLFLVKSVGAVQTADPLIFELPDGSDATERYHGLELVIPITESAMSDKLKVIAPLQSPIIIKPVSNYGLKPGDVIIVGKWIANQIATKSGYTRPHYAFEVVAIEAETDKAFKLKVKLSAQKTVYCGVCGIKLTNPESVTIGIGPICAEKSGINYELGALGSLSTWLPKSSIKASIKTE
jgi:hypothetical protein